MSRNVQVVLTQDLPNVGDSGELVRVKAGYARNFLIPRGLAALATKDNVKRIEHERRVAQARAVKARAEAESLAERLADIRLTLHVQTGEDDKMYGSITSRDIEEALSERGFEVDRRKIVMDPIKAIGDHRINLKIAAGVDAEIPVTVLSKD
jgi:large subunit ribosomal protein L9